MDARRPGSSVTSGATPAVADRGFVPRAATGLLLARDGDVSRRVISRLGSGDEASPGRVDSEGVGQGRGSKSDRDCAGAEEDRDVLVDRLLLDEQWGRLRFVGGVQPKACRD